MGGVWEQVQTSLLGTLLSERREDLGAAPAWSELTLDFSRGAHRAPWTLFSSWSLPQFSDHPPLSCVSRGLPLHLLSITCQLSVSRPLWPSSLTPPNLWALAPMCPGLSSGLGSPWSG